MKRRGGQRAPKINREGRREAGRAARSTPSLVQDIGLGVLTIEAGDRWRIVVHDVGRLRDAFGENLLVAFVRAFAVADRLITLHHLLELVTKDAAVDSPRYERDGLNLIVLAWAYTRELREILGALAQAGVKDWLRNPDAVAAWEKLERQRERWKGEGLQNDVRNKIGFHIDAELCRKGLAQWIDRPPASQRLTFACGEGKREKNGAFPMAHQLMFTALGHYTDGLKLEEFARERIEDHIDFSDTLQRVFLEVHAVKVAAERASQQATLTAIAEGKTGDA